MSGPFGEKIAVANEPVSGNCRRVLPFAIAQLAPAGVAPVHMNQLTACRRRLMLAIVL